MFCFVLFFSGGAEDEGLVGVDGRGIYFESRILYLKIRKQLLTVKKKNQVKNIIVSNQRCDPVISVPKDIPTTAACFLSECFPEDTGPQAAKVGFTPYGGCATFQRDCWPPGPSSSWKRNLPFSLLIFFQTA